MLSSIADSLNGYDGRTLSLDVCNQSIQAIKVIPGSAKMASGVLAALVLSCGRTQPYLRFDATTGYSDASERVGDTSDGNDNGHQLGIGDFIGVWQGEFSNRIISSRTPPDVGIYPFNERVNLLITIADAGGGAMGVVQIDGLHGQQCPYFARVGTVGELVAR